MEKNIQLIVEEDEKNLRLDIFISKRELSISRTRIKNLILKEKLKLNNLIVNSPSKKIFIGDKIDLQIPEPKEASLKPYDFKLKIVYEDNDLLVIDKPAGIIMHPGAGFPGIVLAIFNKNHKFHVKLYEKSNIKCDFLENIKNKLNLNCDILGRYQDDEIRSEYVVSRAFKKLVEILRISRETVEVNHKLIVLKGKNAENEINKLHQPLSFIYNLERSVTDRDSKILIVDVKKNL